ncbi:hypothetical protein [Chitinimonas sp.]|uniref:hypothetical protein n=1 Tax=Chitinimonas sp. TaxID=1934313 RepID=UPI002F9340EA
MSRQSAPQHPAKPTSSVTLWWDGENKQRRLVWPENGDQLTTVATRNLQRVTLARPCLDCGEPLCFVPVQADVVKPFFLCTVCGAEFVEGAK